MEKLTIQKAIENKFTPIDWVKYYFNDISNESASYILWEETCFPFSAEITLNQLHEYYIKNTEN